MTKKLILIGVIVAFVAVLVGASLLYNEFFDEYKPSAITVPDDKASPETDNTENTEKIDNQKQLAPDITVTDINGKEIKLSDFNGEPVILNFWASWCPPCTSEMPDFDESFKANGEKIKYVMVNLTDGTRETTDTAKKFISRNGYSFPVYFDTVSHSASIAYGIASIPMTFFIDEEGYVAAYAQGALDTASLQTGVDILLGANE